MIPLVDIHVHLLAGLDDGPKTMEDAVEMCAMAHAQGVRFMSATAHQNERWKDVTPDRIREATKLLKDALQAKQIGIEVFPVAEVTAQPETATAWRDGKLLSVGDHGQFMLLEMPHGVFADLRPLVRSLKAAGIRLILAHPELLGVGIDEGTSLVVRDGRFGEVVGSTQVMLVDGSREKGALVVRMARPGQTIDLRERQVR